MIKIPKYILRTSIAIAIVAIAAAHIYKFNNPTIYENVIATAEIQGEPITITGDIIETKLWRLPAADSFNKTELRFEYKGNSIYVRDHGKPGIEETLDRAEITSPNGELEVLKVGSYTDKKGVEHEEDLKSNVNMVEKTIVEKYCTDVLDDEINPLIKALYEAVADAQVR